jgi:hypothetical protein
LSRHKIVPALLILLLAAPVTAGHAPKFSSAAPLFCRARNLK